MMLRSNFGCIFQPHGQFWAVVGSVGLHEGEIPETKNVPCVLNTVTCFTPLGVCEGCGVETKDTNHFLEW